MRRLLIIPALLMALAAASCASIPRATLYQAKAAYGTVLATALAYARACERRLIPPSCWTAVEKIQEIDREAQAAIRVGNLFAVQSATSELTRVKSAYGVN